MCTYAELSEVDYRGSKHCSLDKPFPSYDDQKKHVMLPPTCIRHQVLEDQDNLPARETLGRGVVTKTRSREFLDLRRMTTAIIYIIISISLGLIAGA